MKYIAMLIMVIAAAAGAVAHLRGLDAIPVWCALIFVMGALFGVESRIVALERKVNE